MMKYRLGDSKKYVEVIDDAEPNKPMVLHRIAWDARLGLPVEDGKLHFTDELMFVQFRNGDMFKAFKSLAKARQSVRDTPALTHHIEPIRVY